MSLEGTRRAPVSAIFVGLDWVRRRRRRRQASRRRSFTAAAASAALIACELPGLITPAPRVLVATAARSVWGRAGPVGPVPVRTETAAARAVLRWVSAREPGSGGRGPSRLRFRRRGSPTRVPSRFRARRPFIMLHQHGVGVREVLLLVLLQQGRAVPGEDVHDEGHWTCCWTSWTGHGNARAGKPRDESSAAVLRLVHGGGWVAERALHHHELLVLRPCTRSAGGTT